ncbi:MAG TPA: N-acetyltransferase [Bradyrhizobium sp.]|jgi:acetyltransferase-like isoleucine patch superfamily enzyme|nr:N-acetyltransferase [Bradyrhizobium sp.]
MGNIDERHRSDRRRKLIYDANKVDADGASVMPAVHASLPIEPDPAHELALSSHLRTAMTAAEIAELYGRFSAGLGSFDAMMRRVIWRSLARSFGNSVRIAPQAMFRHLERVSIGDGVFIGEGAMVQGHFHGDCRLADRVWIGPQVFLDARALTLRESAAIGPGVKILTSAHTGMPAELPVNATDQLTRAVSVGPGADIGIGAMVLPGCRIGRGVIVGAGAVVTKDIPDLAVAVGVPARVIRFRGARPLKDG